MERDIIMKFSDALRSIVSPNQQKLTFYVKVQLNDYAYLKQPSYIGLYLPSVFK